MRLEELELTTRVERRASWETLLKHIKFSGATQTMDITCFVFSRSGYNLLYPVGKLSQMQLAFIKNWNNLPNTVKNSDTVHKFKERLEAHKTKVVKSDDISQSQLIILYQFSMLVVILYDFISGNQHERSFTQELLLNTNVER